MNEQENKKGFTNPKTNKPYEEYQVRVLKESQELEFKLTSLNNLLINESFSEIVKDAQERKRLFQQSAHMQAYLNILKERIAHF